MSGEPRQLADAHHRIRGRASGQEVVNEYDAISWRDVLSRDVDVVGGPLGGGCVRSLVRVGDADLTRLAREDHRDLGEV